MSVNIAILIICLCISTGFSSNRRRSRREKAFANKRKSVISNPYMFNGYSKKNHINNRGQGPFGYSILHNNNNSVDSIKIIALRVEFKRDSSNITTGDGWFGINRTGMGTQEDIYERNYYPKYGGAAYKYDDLPHDKKYFENQLEYVKNYFKKVSRNRLFVDYEVFPSGAGEEHAYQVPEKMTKYSPGYKKAKESFDEYGYRRTVSLMDFIYDAIHAADTSSESPFKNIIKGKNNVFYYVDPADTTIKKRAAILIFHAGASYLTDGGWQGYLGQDTPSDMIDWFISAETFEYFADSIDGFTTDKYGISGVTVNKNAKNEFTIDELMMVSETSNQDSLNWGIHGILVNQIARQIGIPDLYATMSGISGVGSFCIMDFAGYSSGRGLVPPWPSAWIRAFMGWDTPKVIRPGKGKSFANLKAVSIAQPQDTSILLVPINKHEYYLIENRQRNLTGDPTIFNYDTSETNDDTMYISPYDPVNFDKNVLNFQQNSGHIDSVINFDVSLPASGILIWHVDEYIIRDHLEHNILNADSSYRGISLEEADGVVDLGVMFPDFFYQAVFDYGGAADVFPHFTSNNSAVVNLMGPFTSPSTQSNDGGHTYMTLSINPVHTMGVERSNIGGEYVYNYSDSTFRISVYHDTSAVTHLPKWPKRIASSKYFEPVICDVYDNGDTLELAIVDTSGRVYVYQANDVYSSFGIKKEALSTILFTHDTIYNDTVTYLSDIPSPASFPTTVNGNLYIPSKDGNVYRLTHVDNATSVWDTIPLQSAASSYICSYKPTKWVVGCANGTIVFCDDIQNKPVSIPTFSSFPIQALAVIDSAKGIIAAIDINGKLIICSEHGSIDSLSVKTKSSEKAYQPFTLAVADLDQNDTMDIVVCDRKQGLWLFNYDAVSKSLVIDPQWGNKPNEWSGVYSLAKTRAQIPDNPSSPSIADIDGDHMLDIIVGGTNGIYAFNHRGVMLAEWPAFLDERYWYQQGSIVATPVIGIEGDATDPLVIFSAPTGENITFGVAKIDSANKTTGTIYFTKSDGSIDSASDLSASLIDTLLMLGDSLILPAVFPGGYIDAFNTHAKRPDSINTLANIKKVKQSNWPFTIGGSVSTAPLLCDINKNGKTDIISVSDAGMVYRWEVAGEILSPSFVWPQAGFDNSRSFAYYGPIYPVIVSDKKEIEYFYNYPNPTKGTKTINFKYKLSREAKSARLDIYTYTGHHIFSDDNLPAGAGWNEIGVDIRKYGSAVYRCRLEVDGFKEAYFWKMAVVK